MNGTHYGVPHFRAFFIPHSHPTWAHIRLWILFSNILRLDSYLNVRDHAA